MDEEELRAFIEIVNQYFERQTGRLPELGNPYLGDPAALPICWHGASASQPASARAISLRTQVPPLDVRKFCPLSTRARAGARHTASRSRWGPRLRHRPPHWWPSP